MTSKDSPIDRQNSTYHHDMYDKFCPIKVKSYADAGLPRISQHGRYLHFILRRYGLGMTVSKYTDLPRAIELAKSRGRTELLEKGFNYSWQKNAPRIKRLIEELAGS